MTRYLSVCSGVGTDRLAWDALGWSCAGFAEVAPFASAVLAHRFPDTPNHGDLVTLEAARVGAVDLVVGGTPCQPFSVAGRQRGLDDARGRILFAYLDMVDALRPRWIVWENVPGVLSTNKGRGLGALVGALGELGFGFAWRVLDARFFGLPQRRRRVFLVGHSGGAFARSAAVLLGPESGAWDSRPRATPGATAARGTTCGALTASVGGVDVKSAQAGHIVAFDSAQLTNPHNRSRCHPGDPLPTLNGTGRVSMALADPITASEGRTYTHEGAHNFRLHNVVVSRAWARRLTPLECERAQGMPDDWTAIAYRGRPASRCPAAPRYAAIGNAIAVPVLRWLGERIAWVERLVSQEVA